MCGGGDGPAGGGEEDEMGKKRKAVEKKIVWDPREIMWRDLSM